MKLRPTVEIWMGNHRVALILEADLTGMTMKIIETPWVLLRRAVRLVTLSSVPCWETRETIVIVKQLNQLATHV